MKNTFTIIFYPKRNRFTKEGENPIYARITINGERMELATQRGIEPGKWSKKLARARGESETALNLNSYLESFRTRIFDHYRELIDRQLPVNAVTLKKQFMGVRDDQRTILEVFANHNKQVNSRVGHEYAKATASKFKSTYNHLQNYIQRKCVGMLPSSQLHFRIRFVTKACYVTYRRRNIILAYPVVFTIRSLIRTTPLF